jgi:5-methylcytosine-specific restriction endonuclease McrA
MSRARYWNNLEHERARSRGRERGEYGRTWRRDNPEYMKRYNEAYRQAHPEYMREYREKNADKARERARAYAQSHPTERAIHEEKRRARKLQADGAFTHQEWEALCEYYGYCCLRCGGRVPEIKLTVDHVIPLSKGGSNSIDNIQPLCYSCNMSKRTKAIDYRVGWESRH